MIANDNASEVPDPDYEALKFAGHSAVKALEILIDARRGDQRAIFWVNFCKRMKQELTDNS